MNFIILSNIIIFPTHKRDKINYVMNLGCRSFVIVTVIVIFAILIIIGGVSVTTHPYLFLLGARVGFLSNYYIRCDL